MPEGNPKVVSLRPFVVTCRAFVKLPYTTIVTELKFGPFEEREMAESWSRTFYETYKADTEAYTREKIRMQEEENVTLPDFWEFRITASPKIFDDEPYTRRSLSLIPPGDPAEMNGDLIILALEASGADIDQALDEFYKDDDDPAA